MTADKAVDAVEKVIKDVTMETDTTLTENSTSSTPPPTVEKEIVQTTSVADNPLPDKFTIAVTRTSDQPREPDIEQYSHITPPNLANPKT